MPKRWPAAQRLRCQCFYFCTGRASKLRTYVVDAQEVAYYHRSLLEGKLSGLGELARKRVDDVIVASVDVLDVEAGVRLCLCEAVGRKEADPRVVASDRDPVACTNGAVHPVVLMNVDACIKGATHVDKRGQPTCRQALEPLHCGGRGVGHKLKQPRLFRTAGQHVGYRRELRCEVEAERVNNEQHDEAEFR